MEINRERVCGRDGARKLKWGGEVIKGKTENVENKVEGEGKDSMCFWGGNIIYSEKDVTVRMKS